MYVNLFYKESKSNKKRKFLLCVCGGGEGGEEVEGAGRGRKVVGWGC